jgi:hypothetical protein
VSGQPATVAEAVERRARMIRFHGSLSDAWVHGQVSGNIVSHDAGWKADQSRDWALWDCASCEAKADASEDVAMIDALPLNGELPMPLCPTCRGAA